MLTSSSSVSCSCCGNAIRSHLYTINLCKHVKNCFNQLQNPKMSAFKMLPYHHVHQAYVLAAALLFPIHPRWDVSGAAPRRTIAQPTTMTSVLQTPPSAPPQPHLFHSESLLSDICNPGVHDGERSADADQSSCKHGCQLCSITLLLLLLLSRAGPTPSIHVSSSLFIQLMSFVSSAPMKPCF